MDLTHDSLGEMKSTRKPEAKLKQEEGSFLFVTQMVSPFNLSPKNIITPPLALAHLRRICTRLYRKLQWHMHNFWHRIGT